MNLFSYIQFKHIQKNQWKPRAELEKIQAIKLQKIVAYAYNNVKYYRDLFDSVNVRPGAIQSKADLCLLPITTRSALQDTAPENLVSTKIKRHHLKKITTAGSKFLRVYQL